MPWTLILAQPNSVIAQAANAFTVTPRAGHLYTAQQSWVSAGSNLHLFVVSFAGAPFQWAAVYHKKNVRFIKGSDMLGFLNTQDRCPKRELPCKVSCTRCHSPIASEDRNIPKAFQPDCHIFYAERCMDVHDGMPKWAGHKDDSERMKEEKSDHNIS